MLKHNSTKSPTLAKPLQLPLPCCCLMFIKLQYELMPSILVPSLEGLPAAAHQVLSRLGQKRLLLLFGEIGAGKTTFVHAICRELGVVGELSSPTFSIVNEYLDAAGKAVYHVDLYRLKTLEEALDIGIEEYLDSGQLCFIEWPELIEPLLQDDTLQIKLEIQPDSSRKILFL